MSQLPRGSKELIGLLTAADVVRARLRISRHLQASPLKPSFWLPHRVYLKLDCVQPTGSFKVRGAFNKLYALLEERAQIGRVVTASSGNHGQAVALAAQQLGLRATVVVPDTIPRTKAAAIRRLGAELVVHGPTYDAAEDHALQMASQSGATYVSAYDDLHIMAGQGTCAWEILEAMPEVDLLLVPVGGGGLLAGVAVAAKSIKPTLRVVGVQPEASPSMAESYRVGRLVQVDYRPTVADAVVGNISSRTLEIAQRWVDDVVTVPEEAIFRAIKLHALRDHVMVEGAGALPLAALLEGKVRVEARETVVLILSGANIDPATFREVLDRSDDT